MSSNERYAVECEEKWREIVKQIPFIAFPAGWRVAVIPPFAGAVARFLVQLPRRKATKSIYLDWYDNLGIMKKPYWEVHPYRGDVGRCDLEDIKTLLRMIADVREA